MTKPMPQPGLARFRQRITQKTEDPTAAVVLIVALGDSVTQGITGLNEIAHEAVYHARFKRDLQEQYPLSTFSVINAGVNGHTVGDGLSRLDRDVIRHQPDLVLIAFGLNDAATRGHAGLDEFGEALTNTITQFREQTEAGVVLLTPNMMLTRANDSVPAIYEQYTELMMRTQTDGVLSAYADRIRAVARDTGSTLADVYRAWTDLASSGTDTTAMLANGLNHPTAEAHAIAADVLKQVVVVAEQP